ncbi:MAG: sodium:calcium antiporter [Rhizomicrobium sp.]
MVYGFIGIGFLLFLIGSESVLRGGIGLSKALGLPPAFVGVLVVSLAMAAPELSIALQATARHAPDIALGDIVGSNIANILLVFGLGALLRPMPGSPRIVFRDGGAMILASIVLVAIMLTGVVSRVAGVVLLLGWIAYLALAIVTDWRRPPRLSPAEARAQVRDEEHRGGISVFLFIFGIVCLYFGGRFALDASLAIARNFHIPQFVVALVPMGFGTALPELVTTLAAAVRGHTSLTSSHLITSNIFSILLVLGLTAIIHPFAASPLLAGIDGPIMIGASMILVAFLMSGWRLTHGQGALLLVFYGTYLAFVAWRSGLLLHG